MTRIRSRPRIVGDDEASHQSVEIDIMESISPCHSPPMSPTQQLFPSASVTPTSPPLSPTREAFRRIFDSLQKQEEATRQSPSESPIDHERETHSLERQSPSLASESSSSLDHEVNNNDSSTHVYQNNARETRKEARVHGSLMLASDSSSSESASPDNTAELNDNEDVTSPQSLHKRAPSEVSDASWSSSIGPDGMPLHHSKLLDRYSNISPPPVAKTSSPSSPLDRIESARRASFAIETKADDILAEARSFAATASPIRVASPTKSSVDSSRTNDILQQARTQASTPKTARTTAEVLEMASAVLSRSRSMSPGVSPTSSHDTASPQKKKHAQQHVSLDLPSLDKHRPDWEPQVKSSLSSMSDDEIAFQLNAIRNTPLHQVLSEDSMGMRRSAHNVDSQPVGDEKQGKEESPQRQRSFMGFLRGENDDAEGGSFPHRRRRSSLSSAFGCNAGAIENVFSIDEEMNPLQKQLSKMNPFSFRASTVLSSDDSDARDLPSQNSMVMPTTPMHPLSEGLRALEVDPRMPIWMTENGAEVIEAMSMPEDTFYTIGPSRAIVVHEIVRGNWTWCTAWSPDGGRLALATENHHLAVVETTSSAVWRVRHDERISQPVKNGTTHSIRSIAWGHNFIAIGGTGNAVSILAPIEPYPVLHTVLDTGFVGSLSWKKDSTVLAIGSREDKCLVVNISAADGDGDRHIQSTILKTITTSDWVNAVAFSPGGSVLAIGDRSGTLSLYTYERKKPTDSPEICFMRDFLLEDSVLTVEWSADGKWLYAGGEEFSVSVIDTTTWKVVHMIPRKKWVQFIASSNHGTHVAIGGIASEVTILDVENKWEVALGIELKGMVPLSAKWHPRDQYLALTGQNNSVSVVETTNARHVHGHSLHSVSPVLEVEFSPDGQMVVIGNQAGIVTFFCLEGSVFVTSYELVLMSGESQSIRWSGNGQYVVIGTSDQVIIVGKLSDAKMSKTPPGTGGFSVRKVIRGLGKVRSISIDDKSRYVAVGGTTTQVLDATDGFSCLREWKKRIVQCNAFSPDGTLLASIGRNENLTIYDTSHVRVDKWRAVFTLKAERAGLALAWGPTAVNGLQYLAYGGANNMITIIEIRTKEETWETVLEIPRACVIHDLDWNHAGMLAAAIGDGTVTIVDLEYLQSGLAMNEMDYRWQRQGITCLTEIRRNKGKNSMRTVRWIPSRDESLIAIGGTDGSLEIVDLTERRNCRGFVSTSSQRDMVVN